MDEIKERSNWIPVSILCPLCKSQFVRRMPPNMPPEFAKVIVCMKCLAKLCWWDERVWEMGEVVR